MFSPERRCLSLHYAIICRAIRWLARLQRHNRLSFKELLLILPLRYDEVMRRRLRHTDSGCRRY